MLRGLEFASVGQTPPGTSLFRFVPEYLVRHAEAGRLLVVDAQSVKNTDTAELKGYDAGKKVSGIKRHIALDTQSLSHAIAVTMAEVTDRK